MSMEFFEHSVFFGVSLSLLAYGLGVVLQRRFRLALFNPLLLSVIVTILVLVTAHIDYEVYYAGAKYLSYLLTPATVCLAVPLYEQLELLKQNYKAVLAGIVSGVLTSLTCVLAMAALLNLDHAAYVTLLPKSITTAIGMSISEELGGYVPITVAVILVTGILGNMFAEAICKPFKIQEPIAKGIAIGSASLTALALLVSYVNIVQDRTVETLNFTLTSPTVLVGLFIGALLVFVFSAMTMSAVQTAAQSIVVEVRRQFREIAGIMEGKADPEYAKCVSLCTKGALHEMVAPALMAIIVPIVTGLILGPTGVVGLLGGVSVTGFAMAVFMSNAGGAWDNAKKYIEGGHHGGKGSECHKAAVVGDTVGDPFKDTSGPSLNILIKLCSTVSIVFSGLILSFNLMNLL